VDLFWKICAENLDVLNELKNKTTKAAKRMKESERRCMVDDDIRSRYQERQGMLILRKNVLVIHLSGPIRIRVTGNL
jgi:hypothetical protein